MGTPSLHLRPQHKVNFSFPTPFMHLCHPTRQATPCRPPLPRLCPPTTSLIQVPSWPNISLRTTRPCRTCIGWRFRGAGWCSTPREYQCRLNLHNWWLFFAEHVFSFLSRRAHERPPPHPHRMHPNYGHGHHIHVPQTMSSHPRQPEQRTAWSVSSGV